MDSSQRITKRIVLGLAGIGGLGLVFLFQRTDVLTVLTGDGFNPQWHFVVNRFFRIFLNDAFMLLVLYALFADLKIMKLAVWIQVVDLFILFPFYLSFKLTLEGAAEISSPFLSQFHRLIVHPTLMILLIPAVYYQKFILERG